MKSQEINIYREVQKNADMAIKAIDTISDKVYDRELSREIARQSVRYSEFANKAAGKLVEAKAEQYHSNYLADMMLKLGIHTNTLLNTSTGHIAELMIKGSNNGIIELEKVLKHNEEAGEASTLLARQLIDLEQRSIKSLKEYL